MRAILLLLIGMTLFVVPELHAQTAAPDSSAPYGLTSAQWEYAQKKWKRKNVDATLYLSDSTQLKGQIAAVNDSTVLLWKGEGFYLASAADSMLIEIPLEAVDSVHVAGRFIDPRGGLKGMLIGGGIGLAAGVGLIYTGGGFVSPLIVVAGLPLGMLVGSAAGKTNKHKRYEKRIANTTMRDYALFPASIPAQNNIDSVARNSPFINRTLPAKLISFSLFTGVPNASFQFGMKNEMDSNFGTAIGINITPHWSAEVQGNLFSLLAYLPANGHLLRRSERWKNLHVTGNFSLFKTGRFTDRWYQLIVGAGYTYASVANSGTVYMGAFQTSYTNGYSFKKNLHGFHVQAKAQVFTGPRLALFLMANRVFLPAVTLPECYATNTTTGETAGMEETRADLSWSSVNFGLQFYFRRN